MMINALNSGARVFMADLEDALSPTWANVVDGQAAIADATARHARLRLARGQGVPAGRRPRTLVVRPRGWHLIESHVLVDGAPISASPVRLRDVPVPHGAAALDAGSGPYLYLAKLEWHHEARLWNDVFLHAQDGARDPARVDPGDGPHRDDPRRLRDGRDPLRAARARRGPQRRPLGLPLQRHQEVPDGPGDASPDRAQLTMTVPFMRAYTELLVQTCHRRGAHAIGGMAAFIPNRRDPDVTETALAKVRADKERESRRRLRRDMGRASGPGAGGERGVRRRPGRPARTRRSGGATRSRSSRRSCST